MHQDEHGFEYYASLDEIKSEGYTPIKVWSTLQFFTLAGKKSIISKENLSPIENLQYVVPSTGEDSRYYIRDSRNYDVDTLYFYRRNDTFSGEDDAVESLRRYIDDGRVWLLYTKDHVTDTSDMLKRAWGSKLAGEGQLPYKIFIEICAITLRLEDYRLVGRNLTGFKTVCKMMEDSIAEMYKLAYNQKK